MNKSKKRRQKEKGKDKKEPVNCQTRHLGNECQAFKKASSAMCLTVTEEKIIEEEKILEEREDL